MAKSTVDKAWVMDMNYVRPMLVYYTLYSLRNADPSKLFSPSDLNITSLWPSWSESSAEPSIHAQLRR